jgi:hypothetical protein
VDRAFVSIERRNEIVTHGRALAIVRFIAVRAWHAGSAADGFVLRVPRLVRVVLAHPAGVLATTAFDHFVRPGEARDAIAYLIVITRNIIEFFDTK